MNKIVTALTAAIVTGTAVAGAYEYSNMTPDFEREGFCGQVSTYTRLLENEGWQVWHAGFTKKTGTPQWMGEKADLKSRTDILLEADGKGGMCLIAKITNNY